ncbi:MAG: 16S rRNA (guanine(527)-N(7))-methyltransferase RsmG [Muribaculaceae bacterium]|nr:16S rRNA (guanine(527)-N(7))-methyltransferase RsmG [Muribaculaceae bacterium]
MNTDSIVKYFPNLNQQQLSQFEALGDLYRDWNSKINVISRKDIDNLYLHHVLHSLSIAAFLGDIEPNTRFVDIGTGGGFPAIPLAILYPEASFHLVDRIVKKLRVADEIAKTIGLENVTFQHGDMRECKEKFDYAVSRAVMPLDELIKICRRNINDHCFNRYPNGLICLKGGDISEECGRFTGQVLTFPVNEFFTESFFDSKEIVYVPLANLSTNRHR